MRLCSYQILSFWLLSLCCSFYLTLELWHWLRDSIGCTSKCPQNVICLHSNGKSLPVCGSSSSVAAKDQVRGHFYWATRSAVGGWVATQLIVTWETAVCCNQSFFYFLCMTTIDQCGKSPLNLTTWPLTFNHVVVTSYIWLIFHQGFMFLNLKTHFYKLAVMWMNPFSLFTEH